jgi:hypothetical protein
MKSVFKWVLLAAVAIIVIIGRVKGYDMTEGQAFVRLWGYWLTAFLCAVVALWIS